MVSEEKSVTSNGYSATNHSDKHHKSSHKSKDHDKDKDKHRHKEKDRHKDHKDKDKDKQKDKDSSKHLQKDKDKKSSSSHKSSSSSSNHKGHKNGDDKKVVSSSTSSNHRKSSSSSSSHHKSKSSSSSSDKHKHKSSHSSSKHSSSSHGKKSKDSSTAKSSTAEVLEKTKDKPEIKEEVISQAEPVSNGNSLDSSCDYNMENFKTKREEEAEDADEVKKEVSDNDEVDEPIRRLSKVRGKIESDDDDDDDDGAQTGEQTNEEDSNIKLEEEEEEEEVDDDDEQEDEDESEEEVKPKRKKGSSKKRKRDLSDDDDDEDYDDDSEDDRRKSKKRAKKRKSPVIKKEKSVVPKSEPQDVNSSAKKRKSANSSTEKITPTKKVKKEEVEEVWKWWEEEKKDDGVKWKFLEHKGPQFAPLYERLPKSVKFYYDGRHVELSENAEEIAGFYARMLDNDYTTKEVFNTNFFKDWRNFMTHSEKKLITNLNKCNFKEMQQYFLEKSEQNRNRSKEEKKAIKEKNEEIIEEYGYCIIDGHREKIANFKIEPPGLFRGRGEHPRMGMLKRRVNPEDVIINCSKDSTKPKPPDGHKWKEVRHDNTVTWLASWTENVQNQVKYIMLNPSSKIKGEKDWQKYEIARKLASGIDKIRENYRDDWKSKEMRVRQRAVALYFIDRLALRAGNEKDEDQADTVGCCSLRVEHIQLEEHKDGKDFVVIFDFLGKDSIRYYNEVPVEKRVFKNLQLFMENKAASDDLFDRLNTAVLNKHLTELMPGLTAKVFRTYNASSTLQDQLDKLTDPDNLESEKILSYNRANRAVAILCNHQRSVPKTHQKSMESLREKIEKKKETIAETETKVADAKRNAKHGSVKEKTDYEKKKKQLDRLREQLIKLEVQETDRDENKTIALGTSKLNYLDPRISVAWCKKYNVPIERIYNKTQRSKFRWAIDMAGPDFRF